MRLENAIADVWSREILPYPGMPLKPKNDRPSKGSASIVMRKMSVSSITSSISRRTGDFRRKGKLALEAKAASLKPGDNASGPDSPPKKSKDAATEASNVLRGSKGSRNSYAVSPRGRKLPLIDMIAARVENYRLRNISDLPAAEPHLICSADTFPAFFNGHWVSKGEEVSWEQTWDDELLRVGHSRGSSASFDGKRSVGVRRLLQWKYVGGRVSLRVKRQAVMTV